MAADQQVSILASFEDRVSLGMQKVGGGLTAIGDAVARVGDVGAAAFDKLGVGIAGTSKIIDDAAAGVQTSVDTFKGLKDVDFSLDADIDASFTQPLGEASEKLTEFQQQIVDRDVNEALARIDRELKAEAESARQAAAANVQVGASTAAVAVGAEKATIGVRALTFAQGLLHRAQVTLTRGFLIAPFVGAITAGVTALIAMATNAINFEKLLGLAGEEAKALREELDQGATAAERIAAAEELARSRRDNEALNRTLQERIDLLNGQAEALTIAQNAGEKLTDVEPLGKVGVSIDEKLIRDGKTWTDVAIKAVEVERARLVAVRDARIEAEKETKAQQTALDKGSEAAAARFKAFEEARRQRETDGQAAFDDIVNIVKAIDAETVSLTLASAGMGKTADELARLNTEADIRKRAGDLLPKEQVDALVAEANAARAAFEVARDVGASQTAVEGELQFVEALREENRLRSLGAEQREVESILAERAAVQGVKVTELAAGEVAAIKEAVHAKFEQVRAQDNLLSALREEVAILQLPPEQRELEATLVERRNQLIRQGLSDEEAALQVARERAEIEGLIAAKKQAQNTAPADGGVGAGFDQGIDDLAASMGTVQQQSAGLTQSLVVDFVGGFVDGMARADQSFEEFALSFVAGAALMIAKAIALRLVLTALNFTGPVDTAAVTGKANKGGMVKGFAAGGPVPGPSVDADIVPAVLTPGEYVVNRSAVKHYGAGIMEAINRMLLPPDFFRGLSVPPVHAIGRTHFATGGPVDGGGGGRVNRSYVVADEQSYDRLQRGGDQAHFRFVRDNRDEFRNALGL